MSLNRVCTEERDDRLLTSWLTVGEITARPAQRGRDDVVVRYRAYFESDAVEVVPFDADASAAYAQIRAGSAIRPADGVQLACAAAAGTDLFVTNDKRLARLDVAGIEFITPLDRLPL